MNNEQANSQSNGTPQDPNAEILKLREQVKQLEKQRDEYRELMIAFAMKDLTEEKMGKIIEKNDFLPLEAFIGELQEIVSRKK